VQAPDAGDAPQLQRSPSRDSAAFTLSAQGSTASLLDASLPASAFAAAAAAGGGDERPHGD
jgi:hypothetical protein